MRKPIKPFAVEVRRRNTRAAPVARDLEAPAPPPAAPAAPAPALRPSAAPEPARRVLPCLVSEAAVASAAEETLAAAETRRKRGRPKAAPDDAPRVKRPVGRPPKAQSELAPRKRGRPRKNPEAQPAPQPAPARIAAPAALERSERSLRRAADGASLPRGQRWKRRLPRALW